MSTAAFPEIFANLRALLAPHAPSLVNVHDTSELYYLDTRHRLKRGQPLFFGSVAIKARYVSYHLMPIYVDPSLLNPISPELQRRRKGKSCFNFTQPDPGLWTELDQLTRAGFDFYVREGYVNPVA